MKSKMSWMIAATSVVVLVAISAIALGPAGLGILGGPGAPAGTNPSTEAAPIETPVWHVGDTWTYDVNASSPDAWAGGMFVAGTLTRTVIAADASQTNVSVHGSFQVSGLVTMIRDEDLANFSTLFVSHATVNEAAVDGYSVYRTSDLAKLKDVRTTHVSGSLHTEIGDFTASYTATVETTYAPALNVWSFPLGENETWNASSNATIHAWTAWRLDGPNEYFETGRNFTATVPIRLLLRSGAYTDVATPAGTFSSIPVRLALPGSDLVTTDGHLGFLMGLGNDAFTEPRVPVEAAFSGTAGNVVKAVFLVDGARIVTVLASYHRR